MAQIIPFPAPESDNAEIMRLLYELQDAYRAAGLMKTSTEPHCVKAGACPCEAPCLWATQALNDIQRFGWPAAPAMGEIIHVRFVRDPARDLPG
jgi:hypothetical protein